MDQFITWWGILMPVLYLIMVINSLNTEIEGLKSEISWLRTHHFETRDIIKNLHKEDNR